MSCPDGVRDCKYRHGAAPSKEELQFDDDIFIFLFPQQHFNCHEDCANASAPSRDRRKMDLVYATMYYLMSTVELRSTIAGYVAGCATCYQCDKKLLSFLNFYVRFPPCHFQMRFKLPEYRELKRSADRIRLNPAPPPNECVSWNPIIYGDTKRLLCRPNFVVNALREWYRHRRNDKTPNGKTFEDALRMAERLVVHPTFSAVSAEIAEFLAGKEWTKPESYKFSIEVYFGPWFWRCECATAYDDVFDYVYGDRKQYSAAEKLGSAYWETLKKLDPSVYANKTENELIAEAVDIFENIHPCAAHYFETLSVSMFERISPDALKTILEGLRYRKGVHSPHNVMSTLVKLSRDDFIDWSNEREREKHTDLLRYANALERDGYRIVPSNLKEIFSAPQFHEPPMVTGIVSRRMKPCPHEDVRPKKPILYEVLLMATMAVVEFELLNKKDYKPSVSVFRETFETLMRVPHCWLHGMEMLVLDTEPALKEGKRDLVAEYRKWNKKIHGMYEMIRRAATDDHYYRNEFKNVMKTWPLKRRADCPKVVKIVEGETKPTEKAVRKVRRAAIKKEIQPKPENPSLSLASPPKPKEPTTFLPKPIACDICHEVEKLTIQPKAEAFYKIRCFGELAHSICLHKSCFNKVFDGKRKKEIKNDGLCPVADCGAKMECIHEVNMELTEEMYLKWDRPSHSAITQCCLKTKVEIQRDMSAVAFIELAQKDCEKLELTSEEVEPKEEFQTVYKDPPKAKLPPPPLPLHLAEKAVRLEKKAAESAEKYSVAESSKTKKQRRRQQKQTINVIDLTGASILETRGRNVRGQDGRRVRKSRRELAGGDSGSRDENNFTAAACKIDVLSDVSSNDENDDFTIPEEVDDDRGQCQICHELFFFDDPAVSKCSRCNKHFHRVCVDRWLIVNQTCPNCRINWPSDTAFPPL